MTDASKLGLGFGLGGFTSGKASPFGGATGPATTTAAVGALTDGATVDLGARAPSRSFAPLLASITQTTTGAETVAETVRGPGPTMVGDMAPHLGLPGAPSAKRPSTAPLTAAMAPAGDVANASVSTRVNDGMPRSIEAPVYEPDRAALRPPAPARPFEATAVSPSPPSRASGATAPATLSPALSASRWRASPAANSPASASGDRPQASTRIGDVAIADGLDAAVDDITEILVHSVHAPQFAVPVSPTRTGALPPRAGGETRIESPELAAPTSVPEATTMVSAPLPVAAGGGPPPVEPSAIAPSTVHPPGLAVPAAPEPKTLSTATRPAVSTPPGLEHAAVRPSSPPLPDPSDPPPNFNAAPPTSSRWRRPVATDHSTTGTDPRPPVATAPIVSESEPWHISPDRITASTPLDPLPASRDVSTGSPSRADVPVPGEAAPAPVSVREPPREVFASKPAEAQAPTIRPSLPRSRPHPEAGHAGSPTVTPDAPAHRLAVPAAAPTPASTSATPTTTAVGISDAPKTAPGWTPASPNRVEATTSTRGGHDHEHVAPMAPLLGAAPQAVAPAERAEVASSAALAPAPAGPAGLAGPLGPVDPETPVEPMVRERPVASADLDQPDTSFDPERTAQAPPDLDPSGDEDRSAPERDARASDRQASSSGQGHDQDQRHSSTAADPATRSETTTSAIPSTNGAADTTTIEPSGHETSSPLESTSRTSPSPSPSPSPVVDLEGRYAEIEGLRERVAREVDRLRPIPNGGASLRFDAEGLGELELEIHRDDDGAVHVRLRADAAHGADALSRERASIETALEREFAGQRVRVEVSTRAETEAEPEAHGGDASRSSHGRRHDFEDQPSPRGHGRQHPRGDTDVDPHRASPGGPGDVEPRERPSRDGHVDAIA